MLGNASGCAFWLGKAACIACIIPNGPSFYSSTTFEVGECGDNHMGRPCHRPDCVLGDRGYDAEAIPSRFVTAASCLCSRCTTTERGLALLANLACDEGPLTSSHKIGCVLSARR